MRYIALGCFLLCLFATAANAEWLEASSDHFVIYGDQKEKAVKQFAERLERFHAAMAHVFKREPAKPSPSNRVTIFAVSDTAKVRQVIGIKNRDVAGIYIPRAGASIALIPRLKGAVSQFELSGETILYHEYAHHFMLANLTDRAYPRWFVEGFAEFFAGVKFNANGSVSLGVPPIFRASELLYGQEVPIRKLLDYDGGPDSSKSSNDSFYLQSWALFHYLQLMPERAGQQVKYGQLLAEGLSPLAAAESAFGDLDRLAKDMNAYLKSSKVSIVVIKETALTIAPVAMRKLSAGEAAMMPIVIESKAGVTHEEALSLVPEARKIAALYPNDAAVLAALAEAEFDAENDDAAIAAADRALAIDPNQINAHIQKGYALSRKVQSGALPKESWKDVRIQFAKANRVENDNPIPLVQFYLSFVAQHETPTKNAIDGLEWAMQLAPFDASLRWLVAQQMVSDERFEDAALTLAPLAYSPHPGEHTDMARRLLKEVEARLQKPPAPSATSLKAN
jgi:tetratricopeptide (TPR) repeat protein